MRTRFHSSLFSLASSYSKVPVTKLSASISTKRGSSTTHPLRTLGRSSSDQRHTGILHTLALATPPSSPLAPSTGTLLSHSPSSTSESPWSADYPTKPMLETIRPGDSHPAPQTLYQDRKGVSVDEEVPLPKRAMSGPPPERETEFIGSIDAGTTSCRFYIFDRWAHVICFHQLEFDQVFPQPGWHEHDPEIYTETIDKCIVKALEEFEKLGYKKSMLKGVGMTNQRETTVAWDRETGKAIHNAIAWPDVRNAQLVRSLRERAEEVEFTTLDGPVKGEEGVKAITGLPFSTYFSSVKLAWLIENVPEVKVAKEAGKLMIGTVDSWLLYKYTGGADGGVHLTDVTNASRTLGLSLHTLDWNDELLDFFGVPRDALPKVVSNSEVYGNFYNGHPLGGLPIASLIGDQQAALVGNKCLDRGSAKQTYGTGCFMLYNTSSNIVQSSHGLLTTVGFKAGPDAKTHYALEGSIAVGGSSVQWLRDNLKMIDKASEAGELAASVPDTGGLYFVTGFSGLFAPYWDMRATGMMIGLSTFTTTAHIARATLEATCFQTRAILEAMAKDTEAEHVKGGKGDGPAGIKVLKVDGGMTGSDVTMQLQADILNIDVERPTMRESTALGAAILAGAALKLFGWDLTRPDTLARVNQAGTRVFKPSLTDEEVEWKYAGWNRAVERCSGWKTDSGNG